MALRGTTRVRIFFVFPLIKHGQNTDKYEKVTEPRSVTLPLQTGRPSGATPTGGEPSSGYGLAIAKRFVDRLGGELMCTSTPARGTTFSFWLPTVRPRP